MKCPKCGIEISEWHPRPDNVEAGYCQCHPRGPVVARPRSSERSPEIPRIGAELSRVLARLGYSTAEDICHKTDTDLLALPGLGAARVANVREWCNTNGYPVDSRNTGGE